MNNPLVIPAKAGIQLNNLRADIDKIDNEILTLIKKRLNLVIKIGQIKKAYDLKVKDSKREKEVLEKICKKAESSGLSPILTKKIWQLFFKQAYKLEE